MASNFYCWYYVYIFYPYFYFAVSNIVFAYMKFQQKH